MEHNILKLKNYFFKVGSLRLNTHNLLHPLHNNLFDQELILDLSY